MIAVELAISRIRRQLALAAALRIALTTFMGVAFVCVVMGPEMGIGGDGSLLLMAFAGVWVVLSYQSARGSRLSANSPSLIAAGEFEQAEQHIEDALRHFSLFQASKLMTLHHLALLRHAQRRWRETRLLCQALLSQNLANMPGLARSALLLDIDSSLQSGDLRGAYDSIQQIYHHRLGLNEALTLQLLELDYGSRVGAWEPMLLNVGTKVQFAELMPPINASRSQALLALAARRLGRNSLAQWLRRRAELLADASEIAADRPVLAEMLRETW